MGIKKSRPWLGRLSFLLSDLLYSHRRHPNRKLSFNNKDNSKDDNKGEAVEHVHGFLISPDYRRKGKFVKGRHFRFGYAKRLHFVDIELDGSHFP